MWRSPATCIVSILFPAASVFAQEGVIVPLDLDKRLRDLEERNAELESRLRAVEADTGRTGENGGVTELSGDEVFNELEPASFRLTFQIYGDVGFNFRNPRPPDRSSTSFAFGSLGLFTSAQVGEHFQAVSETIIEGEGDDVGLDQERLWGRYSFSDYFYAKLGLEHTAITRWNRVFHHSKYLEVSIERPFLARFEDDGGFLPMHASGLELGGHVENRIGRFEYLATLTNGRGPTPEDRQRIDDLNDSKALEAAVTVSPHAIAGLRVGGALRFGEIPREEGNPARARSIREWATALHMALDTPIGVEATSELVFLQHRDNTLDSTFHHFSGYLQLAYRNEEWDQWTPYTRFDYRDMESGDPFFEPEDVDLDQWEQLFGVRYDFVENVALKLEIGAGRAQRRPRSGGRDRNAFLRLGVQLAWQF